MDPGQIPADRRSGFSICRGGRRSGWMASISDAGVFHPPYRINWLHLSVGLILIPLSRMGSPRLARSITFLPAALGILPGVAGLLSGLSFLNSTAPAERR